MASCPSLPVFDVCSRRETPPIIGQMAREAAGTLPCSPTELLLLKSTPPLDWPNGRDAAIADADEVLVQVAYLIAVAGPEH